MRRAHQCRRANLLSAFSCLWIACATADPLEEWTLRHSAQPMPPDDFGIRTLVYGNGRFIAGLGSWDIGMILTSTDGIAWVPALQHSYERYVWEQRSAVFGNGRFVTVTWEGQIWSSTNGLDWVQRTNGIAATLHAVAYGGGAYVTVGLPWPGVVNVPWFSISGSFWRPSRTASFLPNTDLADVAYGNGMFVVVGGGRQTIPNEPLIRTTSFLFADWTARSPGFTEGAVEKICYGNGRFVAVANVSGSGRTMLTSSNGIDWVPHPFPSAQLKIDPWADGTLSFYNGTFLLLGFTNASTSSYGSALYISTNGVDWQERVLDINVASPSRVFSALAFGGNTFILGGEHQTILQSKPVVQLRQSAPGTLTVTGLRDRTYGIDGAETVGGSTSQWRRMATLTLSNTSADWKDMETNHPARFYRAAWLP